MPRRHVSISSTIIAPNSNGTQPPSNSLSRLAAEERDIDHHQRHDQQRRLPELASCHSFQITMNASSRRPPSWWRPQCHRRKPARSSDRNSPTSSSTPIEQHRVDARNVDLARLRRRGVEDREPRQQAELDRLPHQRIGAGDHRLAGDHGRRGRQHDHRQQQRFGNKPIERILDRGGVGQHQRALAEIVDEQAPAAPEPNHAVWIGLRPKWPRSA